MAMGMMEEKQQPGAARYLPSDVVVRILRGLPVRSVARSRCVCKQWRSQTEDHRFIDEHRRLGASERANLLGSPEGKRLSIYRFGPNHGVVKGVSKRNPDDLRYDTLSNPVNGLIAAFCVSVPLQGCRPDGTRRPYLINPITRDHLRLPGDNLGGRWHPQLGLGFAASTGAYKLVCLGSSSCMVLTVGVDGAWRRVQQRTPFAIGHSPPVFLDGVVYWLAMVVVADDDGWAWSILAFDVEAEVIRPVAVPMPSTQLDGTPAPFLNLRDFEGRLCFVECSVDNESPSWRVWKLNGQPGQQRWRLEHVIAPYDCLGRAGRCAPSWVVDIRGGKEAILQMFGAVWSYDLSTKALVELSHCHKSVSPRLVVITETLVSPTALDGHFCHEADMNNLASTCDTTTTSFLEPWEATQQKTSCRVTSHTQPSGEGSSSGHMENGLSFDPNGKAHDSSEPRSR